MLYIRNFRFLVVISRWSFSTSLSLQLFYFSLSTASFQLPFFSVFPVNTVFSSSSRAVTVTLPIFLLLGRFSTMLASLFRLSCLALLSPHSLYSYDPPTTDDVVNVHSK